jgi:hypothetical protein
MQKRIITIMIEAKDWSEAEFLTAEVQAAVKAVARRHKQYAPSDSSSINLGVDTPYEPG